MTREEAVHEANKLMLRGPLMFCRPAFALLEPTTALFYGCLVDMDERWRCHESHKEWETRGKRHEYKPPWVHDPRKEGFFPCSRLNLSGKSKKLDWNKLFDEEEGNTGVESPVAWTQSQQGGYLHKLMGRKLIEVKMFGVPPNRWIRVNYDRLGNLLVKHIMETAPCKTNNGTESRKNTTPANPGSAEPTTTSKSTTRSTKVKSRR